MTEATKFRTTKPLANHDAGGQSPQKYWGEMRLVCDQDALLAGNYRTNNFLLKPKFCGTGSTIYRKVDFSAFGYVAPMWNGFCEKVDCVDPDLYAVVAVTERRISRFP